MKIGLSLMGLACLSLVSHIMKVRKKEFANVVAKVCRVFTTVTYLHWG